MEIKQLNYKYSWFKIEFIRKFKIYFRLNIIKTDVIKIWQNSTNGSRTNWHPHTYKEPWIILCTICKNLLNLYHKSNSIIKPQTATDLEENISGISFHLSFKISFKTFEVLVCMSYTCLVQFILKYFTLFDPFCYHCKWIFFFTLISFLDCC